MASRLRRDGAAPRRPPPIPRSVEAPRAPRRRHPLVWVGGVLGALVLALVLMLILIDWNWLRGPIGRYASARTGRTVEIAGDLDVTLFSWNPSATINGLRIGNPKWAGPGRMAEVEQVTAQVRLLPLLKGEVLMPRLEVRRPTLKLLRDAQGRASWDFSNGRKTEKPFHMPPVQRFVIQDGKIDFVDQKRGLRLKGVVNANERLGGRVRGFELKGQGSLNGNPFLLSVTGGPLLNIDRDRPYPFNADIRSGPTRVIAVGEAPKPFDLGQLRMNLNASGPDMEELYDLTGLAFPNTPPYRLHARLVRDGQQYRLTGIGGRVGDSDLAGAVSVDAASDRPFVRADLSSRRLDFDDLAAVFGGAPSTAPGEAASPAQQVVARKLAAEHRIFPDATLKVDRIRSMDAALTYRAASVVDAKVPLRAASVKMTLDKGVLTADPLVFDLPQGALSGRVRLDARGATPATDLDMRLANARLEQLVPARGGGAPLQGSLVGRARLRGTGASVHQTMASADGEVLVVVPGGEIRQAFAELMGVNVVKGLGLLLSKSEQQAPIRCAVAHFQARDGVLTADRIVFDTGPVLGTGSGRIDLGSEKIAFRVQGHPKKPQLVRLAAPVTLSGSLAAPKLGVDTGKAITQGGFAAALATLVSPIAVLLPFVDAGLAKDAQCGALLADAAREGAPVKSARR